MPNKKPGITLALCAIVIWSTLALISTQVAHISSYLVLGIAFLISGLVGVFSRKAWQIPTVTLAVGVTGIFGYHFLYFKAFTLAPAVEANLINYLWPLLIVILSPVILPGYHLKKRHILAGLLGLTGAALIVSDGRLNIQTQYVSGYILAFGASITWAVYSLLTKRLPAFNTLSVGVFCLISGFLSFAIYFLSGGNITRVFLLRPADWLLIILAGLGPLGLAFYLWDASLKRGDPRIIGSLAYLTPLLSTLNLILFAGKSLTGITIGAMILIVGGAILGSWDYGGRTPTGD